MGIATLAIDSMPLLMWAQATKVNISYLWRDYKEHIKGYMLMLRKI
jgi:hypothetical protein